MRDLEISFYGLAGKYQNRFGDEFCPFGQTVNFHPFIGAMVIAANWSNSENNWRPKACDKTAIGTAA